MHKAIFILLGIMFVAACGHQKPPQPAPLPEPIPSTEEGGTRAPSAPISTPAFEPSPAPKPKSSQPPVPAPKTIIVEMFDDAFTPATVTINKGDTMIFTNKSARNIWPASDIHPSHGLYPERGGCSGNSFDACHGLATGESWSFIFTHAGTWGFHDHLSPGVRGTIVVNE